MDQFSLRFWCSGFTRSQCVENPTSDEITQTYARAHVTERLQATSAIDTDATANGIQCAVTECVSKTERKRARERAQLFPQGPCAELFLTLSP